MFLQVICHKNKNKAQLARILSIIRMSDTDTNEGDYYARGKNYWENIPPTIDGMLGGHTSVLKADVQASSRFISVFIQAKQNPLGTDRALDCGSGIGRVTKHFLLKHFQHVDMVEQNKNFLDASDEYLAQDAKRVTRKFNSGLQDFVPEENYYDVIWIQWVIGHLTDEDLISFLKRCQTGLKENGIIVIKDNVSPCEVDTDHIDGSVTRPAEHLRQLFSEAGIKIILERKQYKFPKVLYEVKMFALR